MTYDPLLGGRNYDAPQIDRDLVMRQQFMEQFHVSRQSSPVWDEIDNIVDKMTEAEKEYLSQDKEYQESAAAVQAILQREILRMMRPTIEATTDGKAALEAHLSLVKRVQKIAKDEASKQQAMLNEYMLHYSDKTWKEYLQIKNKK